ncbi:MAG: hypothetical protein NVSMB52_01270 [Chloroflexota bacterium]
MSRIVQRLTGATGILAVLAMVAYIILSPDSGTQGDSIHRITALNIRNSSEILGWTYFAAIVNLLILIFLCQLLTQAMRTEPVHSALRTLAIAGAVGFAVFGWLNKLLEATLAYDAHRNLAPGLVAVLFDALTSTEFLIMFPLALVVSSVSLAALRAGHLPRVLCWVGFPLAAIQLVSTGGLVSPAGSVAGLSFIAFLGTLLWIAATSVALTVRAGNAVTVRRDAPAASAMPELAG